MNSLITFDGIDGVGKSTIVDNLYEAFSYKRRPEKEFNLDKRPVRVIKLKFPTEYPKRDFDTPKKLAHFYLDQFRYELGLYKEIKNRKTKKGTDPYGNLKYPDCHTVVIMDRSYLSTLVYNCFSAPGQNNIDFDSPNSPKGIKRQPLIDPHKDYTKYDEAFNEIGKKGYKLFNKYFDEIEHVFVKADPEFALYHNKGGSGDITDNLDNRKQLERLKVLHKIFCNEIDFDTTIETQRYRKDFKDITKILMDLFNKSHLARLLFLRMTG